MLATSHIAPLAIAISELWFSHAQNDHETQPKKAEAIMQMRMRTIVSPIAALRPHAGAHQTISSSRDRSCSA
jgi:hypothetical protein